MSSNLFFNKHDGSRHNSSNNDNNDANENGYFSAPASALNELNKTNMLKPNYTVYSSTISNTENGLKNLSISTNNSSDITLTGATPDLNQIQNGHGISTLNQEDMFSSSEPPSALSLNNQNPLTAGLYNSDQLLSPLDTTEVNLHRSIANLFDDFDNHSINSSHDGSNLSNDDSSLSSETRENVILGNSSYLNNINYIRDHLEYLNQNVNDASNKSPNHLSPTNSESKYRDYINILPDSIPSFNLTKQFSSNNNNNHVSGSSSNNLWRGVKIQMLQGCSQSLYNNHNVDEIEVNSPVIIKLSPNLRKSLSLSRFLNEWYILSGQNVPMSNRLWTNETLINEFSQDTTIPSLNKEELYFPITLPNDLPGVLYPSEVLDFTFLEENEHTGGSEELGTFQKRLALVYVDNNYKSFKEMNSDTYQENPRHGSLSSNGSRTKSSGSITSSSHTPNESVESASNNFFSMGNGSMGGSFFDKLSKQVTSNPKTPLKVIEILSDIIKVLETLGVVHELGIVHNGITSSNLIKSETDPNDIKITGWEFACSYSENCIYGYRTNHLVEVADLVPYMAPEVSGVLNEYVDYKSDFYSIGIVLYEMLLGTTPFNSVDPNSIIRMHIFHKPIAPYLLAPSWISEKLSTVIMRLLKKNPNDRYKNCYELLNDLIIIKNSYIDKVKNYGESVWNHWKRSETYHNYLVKARMNHPEKIDHIPIIQFTSQFIGRDKEYKRIIDTYNNSYSGGVNMLFISGESGIGKTILLNDLRAGALFKYDFYCTWKFACSDSGNTIYSFLLEGLKTIIGQIFECSEEIQNNWRDLIVTNIPLDLSILFYLIPELRKLLGPKYINIYQHKQNTNSNTPGTPSKEEQSSSLEIKFRSIIKTFYKLVASQGLTVFMDDVHWCTEESWKLLCELLNFEDESEETMKDMSFKFVVTFTTNADQFLEETDGFAKEAKFLDCVKKAHINLNHFTLPRVDRDNYLIWVDEAMGANGSNLNKDYSNVSPMPSPLSSVKSTPTNSSSNVIEDIKPENQTSMSSMISKDSSHLSSLKSSLIEKTNEQAIKFYDLCEGNILLILYTTRIARFIQNCFYSNLGATGMWVVEKESHQKFGTTKSEILRNYLNYSTTEEVRDLLNFAAIISNGSGFKLTDLILASALPMGKVYTMLQLCIETKIISPTSTYYKVPFHLAGSDGLPFDLSDNNIWDLAGNSTYRFSHGCLSAHIIGELMASNKLKELSRLCGLRFHKSISKDRSLNIGAYLNMAGYFKQSYEVARPEEKEIYIEVLAQAGRYASSTYNMKLAQKFFEVVANLVDNLDSRRQLRAILTVAQNHYYFKEYEKCLQVIEKAQIKFGFDRLVFVVQLIRCKIELGDIEGAIDICYETFNKLGVKVTSDDKANGEIYDQFFTKIPISIPEIRSILKLKSCQNPKISLIYQLINQVIIPLRTLGRENTRRLLVANAILAMYKHGVTPFSSMIVLDFACEFAKECTSSGFMKAKELSKVALSLVNRATDVSLSYTKQIYELYVCSVGIYWETRDSLAKYFEMCANESTDALANFSQFEIIIGVSKMFYSMISGKFYERSFLLKKKDRLTKPSISRTLADQFLTDCEDAVMGYTIVDKAVDKFRDKYDFSLEAPLLQYCYYMVIINGYQYHKRYEEADELIFTKMEKLIQTTPLILIDVHYNLVAAGVIAFVGKTSDPVRQSRRDQLFEIILHRFKLWSTSSDENFSCKYALLLAFSEIKKENCDNMKALDHFEEAIEKAIEYDNRYEIVWASIYAARWLIVAKQNKKRIATFSRKAMDVLRGLQLENFVNYFGDEFGKYISNGNEQFNWAGLNDHHMENKRQKNNITNLNPNLTIPLSSSESFKHGLPVSTIDNSNKIRKELKPNSGRKKNKLYNIKETNGGNNGQSPSLILNSTIQACLAISEASNEKSILIELLQTAIRFSEVDYGVVIAFVNEDPVITAVGSAHHIYSLDSEPLSSRTDVCPYSLIKYCLESGEIISKDEDHVQFANRFSKDSYFRKNNCYDMICIPIKNQFGMFGALYLEIDGSNKSKTTSLKSNFAFDTKRKDLLHLFCLQAAIALGKAELIYQMEISKMAAEDATAEKASFLANMSHEIRTPFNSLLSCSIFLLDTNLTSTQREYVEAIKSSAMVTLNIIDGILAFSKIEHGSFTLDNAPFSLNDCIESAIQLGGEQVINNNLELVFFNNCPQIDTVSGDVTRFRQIIINLVGNAIKFTIKGHIIIILNATEITDDRFEIAISVEDTGIGIPELSHNKVFGAFSQVDGSARREFGGSGLGLAISKKLVDIMGGDIRFESEEGIGSTFYLNVSFNVKLFEKPELELNKKVLIYDTHELTTLALKNLLENFSLEVYSTEDLKNIQDIKQYDFIFVDYNKYSIFEKYESQISNHTKVIILAQFGKSLVNKNEKYEALLCPLQRERVIRALKSGKDSTKELKENESKDSDKKSKLASEYPLKILLAEDNLLNKKVALKHLEKFGYHADHAKDGVEVIEMCEKLLTEKYEKYDVILMDIQMPRKDGLATAKEIREIYSSTEKKKYLPKIVALTANVAGDDRENCFQGGMVDFISKPILPNELRRVLVKLGEMIKEESQYKE
ncbi:unnamed protein product [Candida verbasci]|uniref:histidine kinase n=1 Tax=Candida verbasci TaxID=1227364 RepID=A0A9W4TV13_9ASCO|nr:unnamed protein product [Candida verbasci]